MTHYHLSLDPRESQAMYAARFRRIRAARRRAIRRAVWLALIATVAALVIVLAGALPAAGATDNPPRRPGVVCVTRLARVTTRETTYRTVCAWRVK